MSSIQMKYLVDERYSDATKITEIVHDQLNTHVPASLPGSLSR